MIRSKDRRSIFVQREKVFARECIYVVVVQLGLCDLTRVSRTFIGFKFENQMKKFNDVELQANRCRYRNALGGFRCIKLPGVDKEHESQIRNSISHVENLLVPPFKSEGCNHKSLQTKTSPEIHKSIPCR